MDRGHLVADFFLIAHDEFSGKLQISHDLLGCALLSAQLAELIMHDRIVIEGGRVVVTDGRGDSRDEVGTYILESIASQSSTHTVRVWVETFADVLYELVARQLVAEGVVRREEGGRQLMRRRPDRFPATDLLAAARPRLQLEHMLRNPREFDLRGAVMAVLIGTLGMESILDPALDRAASRKLMGRLEENLPVDLRALIEAIRSATAAVSLTIRR